MESRLAHRPRGRRALAWELRQKGIADATIEDVLAQCSSEEVELARNAALKRAATLATDDPAEFRQRIGAFLTRRGFSYEVIEQVVTDLWERREAAD